MSTIKLGSPYHKACRQKQKPDISHFWPIIFKICLNLLYKVYIHLGIVKKIFYQITHNLIINQMYKYLFFSSAYRKMYPKLCIIYKCIFPFEISIENPIQFMWQMQFPLRKNMCFIWAYTRVANN